MCSRLSRIADRRVHSLSALARSSVVIRIASKLKAFLKTSETGRVDPEGVMTLVFALSINCLGEFHEHSLGPRLRTATSKFFCPIAQRFQHRATNSFAPML